MCNLLLLRLMEDFLICSLFWYTACFSYYLCTRVLFVKAILDSYQTAIYSGLTIFCLSMNYN